MSDFDTDNDLKKFETDEEDHIRPIDHNDQPEKPPAATPPASSAPGQVPPPAEGLNLPPAEPQSSAPEGLPREDPASAPSSPAGPTPESPASEGPAAETQGKRNEIEKALTEPDTAPMSQHAPPEEQNLIKKGDYKDLKERSPSLTRVVVGAGWEQRTMEGNQIDVDLSCFLLDRTDTTRVNEDFLYYNNPTALDGAVKHRGDSLTGAGEGDDEAIFLDLNGVPFEIIKMVFVLSIYDEKKEGKNFDKVRDVYLRIYNEDNDRELFRYIPQPEAIAGANTLKAFTLMREGPKWFIDCKAEPSADYLNALAKDYGLIIAEDTG